MKDYDPNKESFHLVYWEVNNISGWVISQKLPVDGHNEFNEQFIENYDENIDKGCIIEIDI